MTGLVYFMASLFLKSTGESEGDINPFSHTLEITLAKYTQCYPQFTKDATSTTTVTCRTLIDWAPLSLRSQYCFWTSARPSNYSPKYLNICLILGVLCRWKNHILKQITMYVHHRTNNCTPCLLIFFVGVHDNLPAIK